MEHCCQGQAHIFLRPRGGVAYIPCALRNSDIPSQDSAVSTHAESVLLSGSVDSKADAARAEAAAGAQRVRSYLVMPGD
jgi:hypothetical protein